MSSDIYTLANAKAKGKRPQYYENPESDRLMAILMAVAGELAVARERVDTLERLLEAKGVLSKSDVDSFEPSREQAQERGKWQQEYIARILRIVQQEREAITEAARSNGKNDLDTIVDQLANS